jgi:hypothetical protein
MYKRRNGRKKTIISTKTRDVLYRKKYKGKNQTNKIKISVKKEFL